MTFYSPIEPVYYILPFIGLIVGLFGTILGGAGGFVFLPVLILGLGVPPHVAVITSLVATLPIGVAGAIGHYRKGNVNFRIGISFAIAGLAGAFTGSAMTNLISGEVLKTGFGIYCILIAIYIYFKTLYLMEKKSSIQKPRPLYTFNSRARSSFFGFSAGAITGAFGTSGAAPLLGGLFSIGLPVKVVVGTSLLIVTSNTLFAIGAHFLVGRIDMTLVLFLTSGALIGAVLGPLLLSKVNTSNSEGWIRYVYAVVMAVLGIIMIVA